MDKNKNQTVNSPPSPPKLADRLLQWFCRADLLDEIQGDLYEQFQRQVVKHGLRNAKWHYLINVISFIRPFALKKTRNNSTKPTIMFYHNLLLTFRNFRRFKTSFFINLIGLSSGLACALMIYLWVNDELSIDKFHEHNDRLYQVFEHMQQSGGSIWTIQITSGPMAEALAEEMPEVELAVTTTYLSGHTLSVSKTDIKAMGLYASDDYFKLFSYELTQGNENQVLSDKKSIVISESLATKLFGTTEDVVGETVEWRHEKPYRVSGVFKDIPPASTIRPDFVLTYKAFQDDNGWVTKWNNIMPRAYLLLREGTDISQFNHQIADFIKTKTNGEEFHRTQFVSLYSDRYLYNHYENGIQAGGRIEYVRLFSIIAIFILLIACINFMNLSTARASRRIKEVGIKKAIGASRTTLIYQYLSESLLMTFLSLLVALLLVTLFLPQFNVITGKQLGLHLNANLILSLLGIVLFTALIAGSYPALYLSGFNPATVLKGKLTSMVGQVWARKGLVVFQFVLSIILIVSVWVIYQQIRFVQTQNLGYEKDNIILFKKEGLLREEGKLETFIAQLKNMPGIINASSSRHDMTGYHTSTGSVVWSGKDPNDRTAFEQVGVNYGLIETLGIEMQAGRAFSKDFVADTAKIIFNKSAINFMGLTDPIGKTVTLDGVEKVIIGVTKDFHVASLREEIKPLFFYLASQATSKIMVRVETGKEQEVIDNLQQFYQTFNPGFVLNYRFMDEDYQAMYESEKRVATLSQYFAGFAIVISCLGLFGLAAFTAERRLKEIGIRKILGSSVFGIIYLLSSDFTKMVLIAIAIALPLSYWLTNNWLGEFAYRIDLKWWIFVGAGLIALFIAWLTVGIQTVKAAKINPSECLKDE